MLHRADAGYVGTAGMTAGEVELENWMSAVAASDLPELHAFVRGLRKDMPAVVAGLSLPCSNGPIKGANTKEGYSRVINQSG